MQWGEGSGDRDQKLEVRSTGEAYLNSAFIKSCRNGMIMKES